MTRRICITGPESTGKSTLSEALSHEFGSLWVPEFSRAYLEQLDRPYTESDLEEILFGQLSRENEAARQGGDLLICDTGPEVIWVWSYFKYGRVSPRIEKATREHHYDLTLLLDTDLPWSPDPLRENPDDRDRQELFRLYESLLNRLQRRTVIIRGSGSERISCAIETLRHTANPDVQNVEV
ncbi:MAG: AAA family ATPase [Puniceicoccales bacterium]